MSQHNHCYLRTWEHLVLAALASRKAGGFKQPSTTKAATSKSEGIPDGFYDDFPFLFILASKIRHTIW
jgi:hypothetical protein